MIGDIWLLVLVLTRPSSSIPKFADTSSSRLGDGAVSGRLRVCSAVPSVMIRLRVPEKQLGDSLLQFLIMPEQALRDGDVPAPSSVR